jgi:predicted RNase H-like HicB family nuclease
MRFEGIVKPPKGKDKYWGVEVPLLQAYTQGTSRKDALEMIAEAIELMVDKKGFKVSVHDGGNDTFSVGTSDLKALVAVMLRRLRTSNNLSLRDVAGRLGSSSPNTYARYERGEHLPSLDKLVELIQAIDPDFEPVLKAG